MAASMYSSRLCRLSISKRFLFIRQLSSFQVIYEEHGEPRKVLKGRETLIEPHLPPRGVLIGLVAAAINPADLNMIQGVYAVKPKLPAVGGNEGVFEVLEIGNEVKEVVKGDWVLPVPPGWGTWQTKAVCDVSALRKLPQRIPLESAATISVNPCTAYRMLKDFSSLQPGDVVIQNGANSGVGISVIQLAKAWGITTVNVVRSRPDQEELVSYLKSLGADHVITEEELRSAMFREFWGKVKKPKLGLNCVGGKNCTEMARHLGHGGVVVTYGGMSKLPVTVPTGLFIFNDLKFAGFWMTAWNKLNFHSLASNEMLSDLCDMVQEGALKPPKCDHNPISAFDKAIEKANRGFVTKKQLLLPN